MPSVEDETLFGFVEKTGFEEDDAIEDELPLVPAEDITLETDTAGDETLAASDEDTGSEDDFSEDELLTSAEDTVFDDDFSENKPLFAPTEDISFTDKSNPEAVGSSAFEQPISNIAAVKQSPAHMTLFKLNILSLSRKPQ